MKMLKFFVIVLFFACEYCDAGELDMLDVKIEQLVDLNHKLQGVNETSINSELLDYLKKILEKYKFNPNELGPDQAEHIKSFGYPVETHIVDSDGYLLNIIRIPHGRNQTYDNNRPVVYMQPGLYCSAGCFIDVGPTRAIAYLLADQGYDVWITNPRGTTFSRNHTIYDSMTSRKYWQFSWNEIGIIEIPNTIDYILEKTGQNQINYIGHSQGTTALFVMLSERPEYNQKIKVAIAMAPIAFLANIEPEHPGPSLIGLLHFAKALAAFLEILKVYDLLPHNEAIVAKYIKRCNYQTSTAEDIEYCNKLWDKFTTFNPDQHDGRDIGILLSHFPAGCSVKQLLHYSQSILHGGFKKYDFGKLINKKKYGTYKPPSYNLSNINAPVVLMYGESDELATPKDVLKLHSLLPGSDLFKVDYPAFGHNDFLYAKDVVTLLHQHVFEYLQKYNSDNNIKKTVN